MTMAAEVSAIVCAGWLAVNLAALCLLYWNGFKRPPQS